MVHFKNLFLLSLLFALVLLISSTASADNKPAEEPKTKDGAKVDHYGGWYGGGGGYGRGGYGGWRGGGGYGGWRGGGGYGGWRGGRGGGWGGGGGWRGKEGAGGDATYQAETETKSEGQPDHAKP